MCEKAKSCCFTGHRIIKNEHYDTIAKNLPELINTLADDGIYNFIAGGALGFDTLAAKAVIEAKKVNSKIRLCLALPCQNQSQNWTRRSKSEYAQILSAADSIVYVSDEYYDGCMQKRNRYMIDRSNHCIFYMTFPRGGTSNTIKYALECGTNLHNVITY